MVVDTLTRQMPSIRMRILDQQFGEGKVVSSLGIECFRKNKAFHYFDTIIGP